MQWWVYSAIPTALRELSDVRAEGSKAGDVSSAQGREAGLHREVEGLDCSHSKQLCGLGVGRVGVRQRSGPGQQASWMSKTCFSG